MSRLVSARLLVCPGFRPASQKEENLFLVLLCVVSCKGATAVNGLQAPAYAVLDVNANIKHHGVLRSLQVCGEALAGRADQPSEQ